MLESLRISNFAIVDAQSVELGDGFTVLTGETGAGKSILVDAIHLVLGGRASADLIRTGEDAATVEALFSLEAPARRALQESGVDAGEELLIKRVVSRSGKNRVYLNGEMATIAMLQAIGKQLVAVAGQHEHQTLLETDSQRAILDGAGQHGALVDAMAAAHHAWIEAKRGAEELAAREGDRARREDYLRFQVEELRRAELKAGEEEKILGERQRLVHAVAIAESVSRGEEALYSGDGAVLDRLKAVSGWIAAAARLDASLQALAAPVESARVELEEVARTLRDHRAAEADPARLQEIEDRLALLDRLRKKHGVGAGEEGARALLALQEALEREVAELSSFESALAARREAEEKGLVAAKAAAEKLTRARKSAAKKLAALVVGELRGLGMPHVEFRVDVRPGELSASGGDAVEFLLAPNPGEEAKPLAKIASGGELSRVMLAIKCAVAEHHPVATYVFDEVDAGIGGAIAERVGKKLATVAGGHQVLCITHLAQIASLASTHLHVKKSVSGGRTALSVTPLDPAGREDELARMLGGVSITDATRAHAREMLSRCLSKAPRATRRSPAALGTSPDIPDRRRIDAG